MFTTERRSRTANLCARLGSHRHFCCSAPTASRLAAGSSHQDACIAACSTSPSQVERCLPRKPHSYDPKSRFPSPRHHQAGHSHSTHRRCIRQAPHTRFIHGSDPRAPTGSLLAPPEPARLDRWPRATVGPCQGQVRVTSSETSEAAIYRYSRSSGWWQRTTPSRSRTAHRAAGTTENPAVEWELTSPVRTPTATTITTISREQLPIHRKSVLGSAPAAAGVPQ